MRKWYQPSQPNGVIPVPYLGKAVIQRLEEIIKKDFKIIEHGSGGSTLWFAERAAYVMSIENDPRWYKELYLRVPGNVALVFNNWPGAPDNWVDFKPFDLLLIDGEPVEERRDWIVQCREIVKPGGYVILDNANRPEYEAERTYLHSISQSFEVIDSNESTSYLVTDICRLK